MLATAVLIAHDFGQDSFAACVADRADRVASR
jgi:hypothetical protein